MLTTILISLGALAVIIITILFIRHKRKTPADKKLEKIIADVKETFKGKLQESATDLIKKFLWYTVYDPDKDPEEQSLYNRQQRRRIKRHYEKFLWKWMEIPEEVRNVDTIVRYLVSTKIETNVVGRYVDLHIKGKHEEGHQKVLDRMKKEEQAEAKRRKQSPTISEEIEDAKKGGEDA